MRSAIDAAVLRRVRSLDVGPAHADGQALESPTREPPFLPGRGWFGAFQMREAPQHQVQRDLRLKAGEHASDTGVKAVAETDMPLALPMNIEAVGLVELA